MTRILSIDDASALKEATNALLAGEVIVYPTDTIYGLGADATNPVAIQKIFSIKERDFVEPVSIVLSSVKDIGKYAFETPLSKKIAEKFLPGPLTLVLQKIGNLPNELTAGRQSIGIRIPNHPFSLALVRQFGKPITSSSANISGTSPRSSIHEIIDELAGPSLALDGGILNGEASTVVDAEGDIPRILRIGAVPANEIMKIRG